MEVNINKDKVINGYMTRTFSNIEVDEFNIITSALNYRLKELKEKLEEYKESDNEKLRSYIPRKEKEILQLKRLINLMQ